MNMHLSFVPVLPRIKMRKVRKNVLPPIDCKVFTLCIITVFTVCIINNNNITK